MTFIEYVETLNDPVRTPMGLLGPLPAARLYYITIGPARPRRPAPAPSRTLPQPVAAPPALQREAERMQREAELAALRQRFYPLPPGWAPARSA